MSGAKDGSVSAKYKYDVFFSLSHQDRNIHTDHFYKALVDAGFRTIRDGDPIDRSEDIKSDLKRAIEQSRISVIILSKNYASSKWCLDQLVMIIDCKRDVILPVFYDVDRFEVGDIKGRIGEAFDRYEEELKVETDDQRKEKLTDKINRWREALSFASDVPEFVLQNQTVWDESKFIQNIIGAIEEKLKVVQEDFFPMEVETEGGLLNQEASSLVQEWNVVFINLMNIEELPENPKCPVLVKLFLQQSYDLTEIPDSFFESMPVLQVLDLSNTSIKTLPRSIASLVKLREFLLRGCELLRELPTEIGELKNLEVFDLEGTELMCLPKEIGRLLKLECLKVSLCRCADNYIERKGIVAIIPRATLSKFSQLKELRILVDPDCEWWDAEVEAIIGELSKLRNLVTLQLYFPTVKLLQKFMKLYHNLSNFRLTVGRHEQQIISSLPRNLQSKFETLDKCLKYVNGKGNADGIGQALEHARALFLDRQWTIEKLSAFKIDEMHRLNFCLVVECNEMDTVVDGGDFYQEGNNSGKPILVWLHYLSLHYMKKLQSIWKGPIIHYCLYSLEILALHTCPELTTIINLALLRNLINLKELIVENCPKVKIIVSAEPSWLEADDDFLPALEKILIVDLPALVSISGVLRIGPKLESIAFSNCPMLKNLSPTDMYSEYMHEIKDESESLVALDSSSSEIDYLHRVFIPLTCYDFFMEQIKRSGKPLYEPSVQNQVGPAQSQWLLLSGDGRRHFGSNMVFDTGVPIFSPAAVTEGPSSLSLSLDEDALFQMNSRSRVTMESEPYPVREGKPDCVYYIRTGLCGYGSSCQFNHPPNRKLATASARTSGGYPERIGQPECEYYLRTGTCKFGYTCKFHHPRDKAGIARRVSLNYLGYPLRPNETECASYLRTGQCKFGSTCKFHHPQPSNMMVPFRGSEWKYSSYLSGSVPIGHYALQRDNVFPERPGHPECLSYMKTGDCKFGASCRFHHPRERLIPAPDCVLSPVGLPLRPGEPLCIFYSRNGMCKYGPSCKFDHPMGKEFTYDLSTSPSADVPGPVVQRLLGSSSATDALTLSSEADSTKPRRLSLS